VAHHIIESKKLSKEEHKYELTSPSPLSEKMEMTEEQYDLAIIGGGLAGLALSILSAKAGYRTILFEKEQYPFHRVCGEYISLESWNFLEDLGLPLSDMNLPVIRRVEVSAPNGNHIVQDLPLGGFGISRYKIDDALSKLAKEAGVNLREATKINGVEFDGKKFVLTNGEQQFYSRFCFGAFGKRSNLDIRWKRKFVLRKPNKLNNYVAIKYHVYYDLPSDLICLHNFDGGYCGISHVEDNKCCLCYLTTSRNLRRNKSSISEMEKRVLCENPYLKNIFETAIFITREPVVISQVSFEKKSILENHILMLGDAAGMITPLCGNGMSMALHGAKLAFNLLDTCLKNRINREELEHAYSKQWKSYFARRLHAGRIIQGFFGQPLLTNFFIGSLKPFPAISRWLIRQTHGEPF
jgi:flavin-dependent dehydrogenase